jgi:ABC-2 type transport system permease protein
MMNRRVILAIAKRDLRRYFNNPTGYVFITLFIFLSATGAFWRPRFFLNNLANLDQLNEVFPYLLLFFVPALAMGVWADERKQGTDELLLTLPATDMEIVLGKYAAVTLIYSVSLLLSLSHVGVLYWLGRPDVGLILANYLGYWLAGAALIAVGMLASLVTSNVTVAFILAALFCSVPVGIEALAGIFSESLRRRLTPLGVVASFTGFTHGVISITGALYFVSLGGLCLYLNVVVLGRRHWTRQSDRLPMGLHHAVRAGAIVGGLVALNLLAARADIRFDATAEKLQSLSPETKRLLAGLPAGRTVMAQAFVSREVPEEYVQQRENLLSTLWEMQALAGPKLDVTVEDTEPYSSTARMARERFGIVPRLVSDPNGRRIGTEDVYLGVAFESGADEQVIPFLEHGRSAEYEMARAVRVVAQTTRKRVGVVDTDARVFGGADFESGRTRLPWAIVEELRKQYEVIQITPWDSIREPVDALLVVLPTTLLEREMDNVFDAIRRGVPTLLVVDPLPAMDMRLAPATAMAARLNPYATPGQPLVRKNTGDIQKAMTSIGVNWPPARIAWDSYRPHPGLERLPGEVVFIGPGSGNPRAFNPSDPATSGLQELLMLYPGYLMPAGTPGFTFDPLISTGSLSGTASYFQLVQPGPTGPTLNMNLPHEPEHQTFTLAARVRAKSVNVIVIADLDFISDQLFEMRENEPAGVSVDNIAFFLNSIDVLAGDDAFVALRTRRVRYRTLERVESRTRAFVERRSREERQAMADAQMALDTARKRLEHMVEDIERRPDLDAQALQILGRNVEETENRKLDVLRANIEQAKDAKIQASRENMEAEVRRIQGTIRTTAVLAPPLPIIVIGLVIFAFRKRRERQSAAAGHRLREP